MVRHQMTKKMFRSISRRFSTTHPINKVQTSKSLLGYHRLLINNLATSVEQSLRWRTCRQRWQLQLPCLKSRQKSWLKVCLISLIPIIELLNHHLCLKHHLLPNQTISQVTCQMLQTHKMFNFRQRLRPLLLPLHLLLLLHLFLLQKLQFPSPTQKLKMR